MDALKEHYVVLEKTFKLCFCFIFTISMNKWITKLPSEENKVPRTLFEARKVAGSTKMLLSFKVSLFIQFTQW